VAGAMTWQRCGLGAWRRQIVPATVWIAAAGAAGLLLARRTAHCELTGLTVPEQRSVAALADGRVRLLPVDVLASVEEGQTLAVLEDERIEAALATASAETVRLRTEVAAAESRCLTEAAARQLDHFAQARGYAGDLEKLRLRESELRVALEGDRTRLDFLRVQCESYARLRGQGAVSELRAQSAQTDYAAAERKVTENAGALSQIREDLAEARRRQEEFTQARLLQPEVEKVLAPLRAAITVQERRVDELSARRALLVLRCPLDGQVSQVIRGVGESVRAGDPILTLVSSRPSAVVVYATPTQLPRLQSGSRVRLDWRQDGTGAKTIDSRVLAVGPVAEQLPARLWRSPSVPEWGWPVRIAIPAAMDVLGGEMVGVSAAGDARTDRPTGHDAAEVVP